MRSTILLLLTACLLACAYGDLVCGTNYCKQNPCTTPVASSSCHSPSVYKTNHAGKCACCPACVTLLAEGAGCKTYSLDHGEKPSAICREPLQCLNGVCTKVPGRA